MTIDKPNMLYDTEELEEFGHKSPKAEFLAYLTSNQVLEAFVQAASTFSSLPPEFNPSALEFLALFFEDGAADVLNSAQLLEQYNQQLSQVEQLQKRIKSLDGRIAAGFTNFKPSGTNLLNLQPGEQLASSEAQVRGPEALKGSGTDPCSPAALTPSQAFENTLNLLKRLDPEGLIYPAVRASIVPQNPNGPNELQTGPPPLSKYFRSTSLRNGPSEMPVAATEAVNSRGGAGDSICEMVCREILNFEKDQAKSGSSKGTNQETNQISSSKPQQVSSKSFKEPKGSRRKPFVRTGNIWVKKSAVPPVSKRMNQKPEAEHQSEDLLGSAERLQPSGTAPEAPPIEPKETPEPEGSLNASEETPATPSPIISRQKLKQKVKPTLILHERKDVAYAEKFAVGGCLPTAKPKLNMETTPNLVEMDPPVQPIKSEDLQQAPPPPVPPTSPKYSIKPSAVLLRPWKETKKPKSANSTASTAPPAARRASGGSASAETLRTCSKTSTATNVAQKRSRWTSNTPTQVARSSAAEVKQTRHTNVVKTSTSESDDLQKKIVSRRTSAATSDTPRKTCAVDQCSAAPGLQERSSNCAEGGNIPTSQKPQGLPLKGLLRITDLHFGSDALSSKFNDTNLKIFEGI